MRLACPKCDARYEVPDDAIPAEGRDVQCSNCNTTWFQTGSDRPLAADAKPTPFPEGRAGVDMSRPPRVDLPPAPDAAALAPNTAELGRLEDELTAMLAQEKAEAAQAAQAETQHADPDMPDGAGLAADDARPAPAIAAMAEPPRRELEESVRAILREEAERETEARRNDAQRQANRRAEAEAEMQTQPELGVDLPPDTATVDAPTTPAPISDSTEPAAPQDAAAEVDLARPSARRDLLPNVEEITSTLQPNESAEAERINAENRAKSRTSAFRNGFLLAIILLLLASGLYLGAERIGRELPALRAPLDIYVQAVDGLRLWLDNKMDALTKLLRGL